MIDLHTHILPGLDDGASSWEDALEMAQMAVDSGVTVLAATSHSNLPHQREDIWVETYNRCLERLKRLLMEEKIPLQLAAGMEIFASDDVVQKLKRGMLLTLNQTRYVLVEFPMDVPAFKIYQVMDRLLEGGYLPVLAHPERYHCVQHIRAHIYEWQQMGVVIQVNKGSILGRFGETVRQIADSILRHRLAAVAASDAHSPVWRTTSMDLLAGTLERKYGESCPWLLLEENPGRILEGRQVLWEEPIPY